MQYSENSSNIQEHTLLILSLIIPLPFPLFPPRFIDALDPFTKSLLMINRKIVPGILTWPTTAVVIEETQNEKLKVTHFKDLIYVFICNQ